MALILNDTSTQNPYSGYDNDISNSLAERPNFGRVNSLDDPRFARSLQFGLTSDGRIVYDDTTKTTYDNYYHAKMIAENNGNTIIYNPFSGSYDEISGTVYKNAALSTMNYYGGNGNMYEMGNGPIMNAPPINNNINYYNYVNEEGNLVCVNKATGVNTVYYRYNDQWLSQEQCSNLFIRRRLKHLGENQDIINAYPVFQGDYKPINPEEIIESNLYRKTDLQMEFFDYLYKYANSPQGKKIHDEYIDRCIYANPYEGETDPEILKCLEFIDRERTFEEFSRDFGRIMMYYDYIDAIKNNTRFNPPKPGTVEYFLKEEEKRVGKTDDMVDAFKNRPMPTQPNPYDNKYTDGVFMNDVDYDEGETEFMVTISDMLLSGINRKGKAPTERGKKIAMELRTEVMNRIENATTKEEFNKYNKLSCNPLNFVNVETDRGVRIRGNIEYTIDEAEYLTKKYNFKLIFKRGDKVIGTSGSKFNNAGVSKSLQKIFEESKPMTKEEREAELKRLDEERKREKIKREKLAKKTPRSGWAHIKDKLSEYKNMKTLYKREPEKSYVSWFTDIYYYSDIEIDGFMKSIADIIEKRGRDAKGINQDISTQIRKLWFDNIESYFRRRDRQSLITATHHYRKAVFDNFKEVYDLMEAARLPDRVPATEEEIRRVDKKLKDDPDNIRYRIDFTQEQIERLEVF